MSGSRSHAHVLVQGGTLVTMDPERRILTADLLISQGKIAALGKELEIPPATRLVDAAGMIVLPGLVQGHTHLGQTLFRGLAEGRKLMAWLEEKIWPLEAAHDQESAYWSGMLGIADCLLSGTTTVNDMGLVRGTDDLARAMLDSGIRGILGHCLMDRGPRNLKLPTEEALQLAEKTEWSAKTDRIEESLCPRFILSCSEDLWKGCLDIRRRKGFPIHTHLLESSQESRLVRAAHGVSQMEYLDALGVLDANLRVAHGVCFDEAAASVLAGRTMSVIHCPSANLKLGSGVANLGFLRSVSGISLGIGCDGAPCNNNLDVMHEMRLAALLQSNCNGPECFSSQRVLELATIEGAGALGKEDSLGSLEVGKRGDVTVLDINRPQSLTGEPADLYDTIVYSATRDQISWVLVDGEILVDHGELPLVDLQAVLHRSSEELRKLLTRSESHVWGN